jgi:DNA polymerase-4
MSAAPHEHDGVLDVLHVDMDCFFAAVEVQDHPELAGRPVIVGGTGPRGVVAACTYEARAFGVHSAQPTELARRCCPSAVVLSGRFDRYAAVSRQLLELLGRFTPNFEPLGLDEAYLDVSGAHRLFGPSDAIAAEIRSAVRAELGLSCSVGVGRTKLIAKLASRAAKPIADRQRPRPGRGVVVVEASEERSFLEPLRLCQLPGVGMQTAARLRRVGLVTVADCNEVGRATVERLLGGAAGRLVAGMCAGHDPRRVQAVRSAQRIGREETFASDCRDAEQLHRELVRLSDAVVHRLAQAALEASSVQVKVRSPDFVTRSRQLHLEEPTAALSVVLESAEELLSRLPLAEGVRLLGVAASELIPAARPAAVRVEQLCFAGLEVSEARPAASPSELGATIAAVRRRFGVGALGPATLLGLRGLEVTAARPEGR